jgi:hypothetical protein
VIHSSMFSLRPVFGPQAYGLICLAADERIFARGSVYRAF